MTRFRDPMQHGSPFTRRRFVQWGASAAASGILLREAASQQPTASPEQIQATVTIDPLTELFTVPANFTGLSYESAQLANPAFFSGENKLLIALFRELTPAGVLRLGGGTSEFTAYSEQTPAEPVPFEVFGPDTSKTTKKGTTTSALALRNLRAFLDATGWSCLYGLNLGQGTKENAVAEAEAVHRILGPRVLALQIGNEPDSFKGRYRPASYTPEDFVREWLGFHDAILARVPEAKFAGPDVSNKLSFLTAFAEEARRHPDVILLTAHYYAMGPAGRPETTIDNLLSASPKLTTLKWSNASVITEAMHTADLPFRMSEGNSCWNGGQPGVSDVFASALWCADTLLHFATLGWSGANMHGGGNGIYSPIVGSPSLGFSRRPEFFGMQFAQHFAGATLLHTQVDCSNERVTAYAGRTHRARHGADLLAIVNKSESPVAVQVRGLPRAHRSWHSVRLSAPSLESKSEVTLAEGSSVALEQASFTLPPYVAALFVA